jgi:hypothetical protein
MTEEEIKRELEELQSHPMFMTELPEKPEENPYLSALQSLQYEGNPEDVAKELMEKSQEALNKYKETKIFDYLKECMFYICNAIDHVKDDSTVPDVLKYDLYYFRTQIQLMVKNYGYAIEDLKSALFYVDNDDAYLSLIECYVAQENYERALKEIKNRIKKMSELEIPQQMEKLKLFKMEQEKVLAYIKEIEDKLEKMETFKNLENKEKLKLYDILTRRGIKIKPQVHKIPANVEANIFLDEDRIIHFPVLIVYEEFNTIDYIQDVDENCLISDLLEILFGEHNKLPWDKENKYNMNTCTAFYELSKFDSVLQKEGNYYYPLRNDDKLIDVLTNKQVYMSGFPVIVILSQISNFYPHFLKNKVILKRK